MAALRFPCASRETALDAAAEGFKSELFFAPIMMLGVAPSEPCVPCLPSLSQVMAVAFRADGQIMLVCCSAD